MINQVSRRIRSWVALTLLALAATVLAACSTGADGVPHATTTVTASDGPSDPASSGSPSTSPSTSAPTGKPVHVMTLNSDGATYGVGMPIIAYFSVKITDGRQLQHATTVTANGQPVAGGWYFETSSAHRGYPIEGHWRPKNPYWPAHSRVHVDIPVKGLSAGTGLVFDDSLTLSFAIGASHILTVNDATHMMTVVSDSKPYGTFPVSLGDHNVADMRTLRGTKVIMEKVPTVCMHDADNSYYECGIKWDQRLTYSGEYLHSAPWNCDDTGKGCDSNGANHIGHYDSSNGCTNLLPADAVRLYKFLQVGDVVRYPNADGHQMGLGEGYGDWNVPWSTWQTGGLVRTM